MNNCSIIDRTTKEPKVVYKPDNGDYTTDLVQALKDSANKTEIGYMQNGEFKKIATAPKYSLETQEGIVQHFIENEMLKPIQKSKDTYEAVDSLSAEFIEDIFINQREGEGYTRQGLDFIIPKETPISKVIEKDTEDLSFNELSTKYGKTASHRLFANKVFNQIFSSKKTRPVNFTEETLLNKINVFMKQMGLSTTSIDEYKKKYSVKNGVEPNAQALININERIIAFANGEVTLNELTEEISHFILEGMNQTEINQILPYTTETSYYEKYSELYREAYEKQVGKELAEKYVQKEVLGKMLSDFLQKDFNLESKSRIEQNIFSKLGELLTKFINFVRGRIAPSMVSQINMMFEDIQNRLYNENLNDELIFNGESYIKEMYSLSTDPKIQQIARYVDSIRNKVDPANRKPISANNETEVMEALVQLLNDLNKRTILNINRINEANRKGENIDASTFADSTLLISLRNNLEYVLGVLSSNEAVVESKEFKIQSIDIGKDIVKSMSELNQILSANSSVQDKSLDDIMIEAGITSKESQDRIHEQFENKRKDLSWWLKNMGNISKSDNPLVGLFAKIVDKVFNKTHIKTQEDLEQLKELEDYTISERASVIDGNYWVSDIDKELMQQNKDKFDYELRKKVAMIEQDVSFEDFEKSDAKIKPMEINAKYYEYQWQLKQAIAEDFEKGTNKLSWYKTVSKEYAYKEMQKYKELGIISGNDKLFVFLTNQSDTRRKYSTSDDAKREIGAINYRDRKAQMNIFDSMGEPKEGIKFQRVEDFKKQGLDYIELNHKKGWGISLKEIELEENDDRDIIVLEEDAKLTYDLIRWTQMFEKLDDSTSTTIKENYKKEFENKLKEIKHLQPTQRAKEIAKWVTANTQFTMSEAYWDKLGKEVSGLELLKKQPMSITDQDIVAKAEYEIVKLELRRKVILDKTKDPSDPKEINSTLLTEQDKDEIRRIEELMYVQRKTLEPIFKDKKINMYGSNDSIPNYNKYFYDEYKRITKSEYREGDIKTIEEFFDKVASTSKKMAYIKLKDALTKNKETDIIKDLKKHINKKEPTIEDIKIAFMRSNSPIYYKRYDTDIAYGKMMEDFRMSSYTEKTLIDFVNDSLSNGGVLYKGVKIKDMEFSPNFRFASQKEPKTSDLYQEYLDNKHLYKTELEKYNALKKVLKTDDVADVYKRDFSKWLNDARMLKMYNTVLEFQLNKMQHSQTIDKFDPLMIPQFRKSSTERMATFVTNKNKWGQIKETVEEFTRFREDDENDAYITQTVPLYGYRKISKDDISNDLLAVLSRFSYESNLYVERKNNLHTSNSIMNKVFEQTYGNKTGFDSNYYKMLKELQQVHFFGRRLTAEAKVNVFGKERDIAKMAVSLKNVALGVSLKLSPIVALTNATTGLTTLQIMKWVGDGVYTPADDRAMGQLGTMVSGGVSEVGAMFANNRLNKIGENFGIFSGTNRLRDTNYGKAGRILPNIGYGLMELTNYPLATRVLLNKLMELRVVNGKVYSWSAFKNYNMVNHPTKNQSEIKSEFDEAKNNSLWDMLDENGKIDYSKLQELGVTESLENIQLDAMSKIRDINEEVTGQLGHVSNPLASYNPWAQFIMSLKKWMVIATTNVFSNNRYDINREGMVQGMYMSPRALWNMIQDMRKNHTSGKEAWNNLSIEERNVLKNLSITGLTLLGLLIIASATMKYADDDDEKDNYLAQLTAYMTLRTLNEASSASYGLLDNYYQALQNPVQTLQILKDGSNLLNVGDIGETMQTGRFKGYDKYGATVLKLLPLKNLQTVSSPYTLETSREGYVHFGKQGSIYNILNLLPNTNRNE